MTAKDLEVKQAKRDVALDVIATVVVGGVGLCVLAAALIGVVALGGWLL